MNCIRFIYTAAIACIIRKYKMLLPYTIEDFNPQMYICKVTLPRRDESAEVEINRSKEISIHLLSS